MEAAVGQELARISHDASLRALDKQESLLDELRSRTGILLAASSLATSFLGREAFAREASNVVIAVALTAFVVSIAASVYVLLPKDDLVFSLVGSHVFERLYQFANDEAENHRRLAYDLDRFWDANDRKMQRLFRAFRVAAFALVVEILALATLLSDTLF